MKTILVQAGIKCPYCGGSIIDFSDGPACFQCRRKPKKATKAAIDLFRKLPTEKLRPPIGLFSSNTEELAKPLPKCRHGITAGQCWACYLEANPPSTKHRSRKEPAYKVGTYYKETIKNLPKEVLKKFEKTVSTEETGILNLISIIKKQMAIPGREQPKGINARIFLAMVIVYSTLSGTKKPLNSAVTLAELQKHIPEIIVEARNTRQREYREEIRELQWRTDMWRIWNALERPPRPKGHLPADQDQDSATWSTCREQDEKQQTVVRLPMDKRRSQSLKLEPYEDTEITKALEQWEVKEISKLKKYRKRINRKEGPYAAETERLILQHFPEKISANEISKKLKAPHHTIRKQVTRIGKKFPYSHIFRKEALREQRQKMEKARRLREISRSDEEQKFLIEQSQLLGDEIE